MPARGSDVLFPATSRSVALRSPLLLVNIVALFSRPSLKPVVRTADPVALLSSERGDQTFSCTYVLQNRIDSVT